jgi:hypothetical protein
MDPIEAYYKIREACLRRPELRFSNHEDIEIEIARGIKPALLGFCYVATEVFCHLVPEARPYKHKERNHIFSKIGDHVWDLTAEQYETILDYDNSYRRNRRPLTKRGQLLLEETML